MADRMSPAKQIAKRNEREMEIASIQRPAQRDSALAAYNRAKGIAGAKASLASTAPPKKELHIPVISNILNALKKGK